MEKKEYPAYTERNKIIEQKTVFKKTFPKGGAGRLQSTDLNGTTCSIKISTEILVKLLDFKEQNKIKIKVFHGTIQYKIQQNKDNTGFQETMGDPKIIYQGNLVFKY